MFQSSLSALGLASNTPQQAQQPIQQAHQADGQHQNAQTQDGQTGAAGASATTQPQQSTVATGVRILQALALYLTFLPVVVAIALQEIRYWEAMVFGVAFSGFLVVLNTILWATKQKKEPPYILDVALAIYFAVHLAIWYLKAEWVEDMIWFFNITIHGWLAFVMLVSLAARYPFALQNAKEAAPQLAWQSKIFRTVVDQVSGVWGGSQALCSLLAVAPYRMGSVEREPLNIVFNYLVPLLTLVIMFALTRWWPRFIRIRVYLPRMHQGAVNPDGTPVVKPGEPGAGAAGVQQQGAAQGQGALSNGGAPPQQPGHTPDQGPHSAGGAGPPGPSPGPSPGPASFTGGPSPGPTHQQSPPFTPTGGPGPRPPGPPPYGPSPSMNPYPGGPAPSPGAAPASLASTPGGGQQPGIQRTGTGTPGRPR